MITCKKCGKTNRDIAIYCKWCGVKCEAKKSDPLEQLVGMNGAKQELTELIDTCHLLHQRSQRSSSAVRINMNMVIAGHTGTGKSLLVEVLYKQLHRTGILTQPNVCVVDAVDWAVFCNKWDENINRIRGGMLCIDNAQKLLPDGYSGSICELDRLFNEMGKWENDPIVVISGLPEGLNGFFTANPVIRNRFRYFFQLPDRSAEELREICINQVSQKYGLTLDNQSSDRLLGFFKYKIKNSGDSFSNAHLAIEKAEDIFTSQLNRTMGVTADMTVIPDDIKGDIFEEKSAVQILEELDRFVGLENIKDEIRQTIAFLQVEKLRNGGQMPVLKTHYVFTGNPGTGKTTIARVMADVFRAMEVLPIGHLIETDRSGLVGRYQGETALKTNELVDKSIGGVLFIDEAYNLLGSDGDSFGKEAINTLLKRLEDDKGKFICIVAGYSKEMHEFIDSNPGLKSRFNRTMEFRDYQPQDMVEIFRNLFKKDGMYTDEVTNGKLHNFFDKMYTARDKNFGNAREVVKVYELARKRQGERVSASLSSPGSQEEDLRLLTWLDIAGDEEKSLRPLSELLSQLDEFVGLQNVKHTIRDMATYLEMERMRALSLGKNPELVKEHMVFTGNPGTGKTTIARVMAEICKSLGILAKGHLIEADRSALVAGYSGQTAIKTNQLVDRALGGVLFIDEAYTLSDQTGNDSFGKEAIDTLLKRLEDDRGKFICIVAGYTREMQRLIESNPGLQSRFNRTIHFEDYNPEELADIYRRLVIKKGLQLTPAAETMLLPYFERMYNARGRDFGNAREVRKCFEQTSIKQSRRLALCMQQPDFDTDSLLWITPEDIDEDLPVIL